MNDRKADSASFLPKLRCIKRRNIKSEISNKIRRENLFKHAGHSLIRATQLNCMILAFYLATYFVSYFIISIQFVVSTTEK